MGRKLNDLSGKTYDLLTVIEKSGVDSQCRPMWKCECACGGEVIVDRYYLARDREMHKSCGCLSIYHGKTKTKEYMTWVDLRRRCYEPDRAEYPKYGGRGIKVCDRWLGSFMVFLSDMGEAPSKKHSIDRIDVNGNYDPSNCKWSTIDEQNNNKTNHVLITYKGQTLNLMQWSKVLNIQYPVLWQRLNHEWSVEETFETSVKHKS